MGAEPVNWRSIGKEASRSRSTASRLHIGGRAMAGTQHCCQRDASRLVRYTGRTKVASPISSPDKTRTSLTCRGRGHHGLDGSVQSGGLVYGQTIFRSGATIDLPTRQQCRVRGRSESIGTAHTTRFRIRAHVHLLIGRTSSTTNLLSRIPCHRMLRQSAAVHEYAHGLNNDSIFYTIDFKQSH